MSLFASSIAWRGYNFDPRACGMLEHYKHFEAVCSVLRKEPGDTGWMQCFAQDDWQRWLLIINNHLITPTVYENLAANELLFQVPQDVRQFLTGVGDLTRERNRSIYDQLCELDVSLAATGLTAIATKGAARLLRKSSGKQSLRLMSDIDLLVREENKEQFIMQLCSL